MRVELTKRTDGGAVLKCVRGDGTSTWQRHEGAQAGFFPFHDLTHYAVETRLRFRDGFFGLVAAGWDIADATGKGTRGPLGDEAVAVEHLVGLIDLERSGGAKLDARDLNAEATRFAVAGGRQPPAPLTDEDLDRVRGCVCSLYARWVAVVPGSTLVLDFDPSQPTALAEPDL